MIKFAFKVFGNNISTWYSDSANNNALDQVKTTTCQYCDSFKTAIIGRMQVCNSKF